MRKTLKNEYQPMGDEEEVEATPQELRSVGYTAIAIALAFLSIVFLIVYLVV
jgi:hypothetical protein